MRAAPMAVAGVVLAALLTIMGSGCGWLAAAGGETASVVAGAPTTATTMVSLPYDSFLMLRDEARRCRGGEAGAHVARADLSLDVVAGAPRVRARVALVALTPAAAPLTPLVVPSAVTLAAAAADPPGAVVVGGPPSRPELWVLRPGPVTVDLEFVLPPRRSVVLDTVGIPVATVRASAERAVVLAPALATGSVGGERRWLLGRDGSLRAVVALEGSLAEATRPDVQHEATVVAPLEGGGTRVRTVVMGEGLGEEGGVVVLEVAAGGALTVEGPHARLLSHEGTLARVALEPGAGSPWGFALTELRPPSDPAVATALVPPRPVPLSPSWRGGLVAFGPAEPSGLGPTREALRGGNGLRRVLRRDDLKTVARLVGLTGEPRAVLAYVAAGTPVPLQRVPVPGAGGLARLVSSVAARTSVERADLLGLTANTIRTQAEYEVGSGSSPLELSFPQGSRLLSLWVDGASVKPPAREGTMAIPLRSTGPAKVSVAYESAVTSPGAFASYELALPAVGVPVLRTSWTVQIPDTLRIHSVHGSLEASVPERPFVLLRAGLAVVDGAVGVVGAVRSGLERLLASLTSTAALPLPVVIPPLRPLLVLHGGLIEPGGATSPSRVVVEAVDRSVEAPLWMAAFLGGLLLFGYVWTLGHDAAPVVPAKVGLPVALVLVWLLDVLVPYASPGLALAFVSLTLAVGLLKLSLRVERSLHLARLRNLALAEAGTIGDLEGQAAFFATREKKNIVGLGDLFAEDEDDDGGIEFLAPDPGAEPRKGGEGR